jgi:predicted dehydrogenase
MSKKPLKIAVVGSGRVGSLHARTYAQLSGVKLIGVCDINPRRANQVADQCRTKGLTDYRQLLKEDIDGVSIAVPTSLHYKLTREFLNRNINVLVEKPITATLKQADNLLALAGRKNLILQVGHVERFNAAVEAIQKLPAKPLFIECHRLGPYQPRVSDVGVVLDLMIHDIDIIFGLVKSKVKTLQAIGVKILSNYEDIANARITFADGTVANVTASRVTDKVMRKIRIFQQNAYISLDYVTQTALIYQKIKGQIIRKEINIQKEHPLKKELRSFLACVRKKRKPQVSGKEAREALNTALTIIAKIKKHR